MIPSPRAFAILRQFERLSLVAYEDPGGIYTIGYGATTLDGEPVEPGTTITGSQADALLQMNVATVTDGLNAVLKVPVSQEQFDALVSWAFNIGVRAARESTLVLHLNSGKPYEAALEFVRWIYQGVEVLNGLIRRRIVEAALFLDGTP